MVPVVRQTADGPRRGGRGLAAAAACLMLGACAQGPSLGVSSPQLAGAESEAAKADPAQQRAELEKATAWWARKYAENPRDLDSALSYARNLKALGEKQRALAVLQQAEVFHGESRALASEYGRLALDLDQIGVASRLLAAADDPGRPDWRVISARGTVLAKQGRYGDAIPYYERALTLAPDHPSILSNLALARAMNGEPAKAEQMLRQAAAVNGAPQKIRQNLALVLGLQGKYDEAKQLAALDMPAEKAAENSDYLRRIVKLEPKPAPGAESEPQVAARTPPKSEPAKAEPAKSEPDAVEVAAATEKLAAKAPVKLAQPVVLPVPKRDVMLAMAPKPTAPKPTAPKPVSAAKAAVRPAAAPAPAPTGQGAPRPAQAHTPPMAVAQGAKAEKPAVTVAQAARSNWTAAVTRAGTWKPTVTVTRAGMSKPAATAKSEAATHAATVVAAHHAAPAAAPSVGSWSTQVALAEAPKPKKKP